MTNILHSKAHMVIEFELDLRARVVVQSVTSDNGLEAIDYLLKAKNGPYGLTLVQNPLIDYDQAIIEYENTATKRKEFMRKHGPIEPPDCSWQQVEGIWLSAHWYTIDEIDRMTVGMSAAAWLGLTRTHTITII